MRREAWERPVGSDDVSGLRLQLQVPDEPLRRADPRPVTVVLTNDGTAPVVVNRRMAPGYVDSDSREVYFDVNGEYGRCKYERNPPTPGDFAPLGPGAQLTVEVDLLGWYRLREAGTYRVRAHYCCDEDWANPPPGTFWGVVDSNPVTLRVE
jgi:hypothetical protein